MCPRLDLAAVVGQKALHIFIMSRELHFASPLQSCWGGLEKREKN
jgi:hypothetical protein